MSSHTTISPGAALVPDSMIDEFISQGIITAAERPFLDEQVQPASLDLRLGTSAYRIRGSFLPGRGRSVQARLETLADHEFDLTDGAVLEKGCVYLIPIIERLNLPDNVSASANPKSSTGRLDIFTRLIADGTDGFDAVEAGFSGPLYAEVSPRTFSVKLRTGTRLLQMRFRQHSASHNFSSGSFLNDADLRALHKKLVDKFGVGLVDGKMHVRDGLVLSVSIGDADRDGRVGFRARRYAPPIDFDRPDSLEVDDYWEPIYKPKLGQIILDPNEFYILRSSEAIQIPPDHAAEMVPIDPTMGEFRVHYAGFFDPGFGYSPSGGAGSRAVLEVRSHEVPFVLENKQPIGRLRYELLIEPPSRTYGAGMGSHYQAQGLKLSKHFRAG